MKPETLTVRRIAAPITSLYPVALMPCDEHSFQVLQKLDPNEETQVRIIRERSLPQHRLFWAVLDHVAKSSKWENPERLLVALKIRLGKYDLMQLPSGKAIPVPQSISFEAMDQIEFQRFFDDSVRTICAEILDGYDADRLIREAQGVVPV